MTILVHLILPYPQSADLGRQVREIERGIIAEEHRSLDDVAQFANVARPVVRHQRLHRPWGDILDVQPHALIVAPNKETDEIGRAHV